MLVGAMQQTGATTLQGNLLGGPPCPADVAAMEPACSLAWDTDV
ncbi:hypothetical protein QFZ49_003495 [Streptomyces turgidiscabies]|uniref:Uncharacterized protein n=1 Tax=Streptomyces turgidiscabies TaxID=85558 RepID=A0ABU0RRJ1_9ACTN|nr:hypothetical protein [Streptomyces turgidiscabies]